MNHIMLSYPVTYDRSIKLIKPKIKNLLFDFFGCVIRHFACSKPSPNQSTCRSACNKSHPNQSTCRSACNKSHPNGRTIPTQAISKTYRSEEHTSELQSRENLVCR